MAKSYRPVDLEKIKTFSALDRTHRSSVRDLASLPEEGASAAELVASMPDYLGARAFRKVVEAIVQAVKHERPVVVAFGAHVIKVGCGPILIDLIRRGVIGAIAGNGACTIHDAEMALFGETSEDVSESIRDGRFGMATETMAFFDEVVARAQRDQVGLGAAVGQLLVELAAPQRDRSVFVAAHLAGIPACVHVAVGTDTIHCSPGVSGEALGAASMHDFRLICDVVSDLGAAGSSGPGGVWLNVGSAVLLPEVFLKAVSVARNLGADLDAMTTANFDMIRHYRPSQNVVTRPVSTGRGFEVVGQHEILLPLLRQAVVDGLAVAG